MGLQIITHHNAPARPKLSILIAATIKKSIDMAKLRDVILELRRQIRTRDIEIVVSADRGETSEIEKMEHATLNANSKNCIQYYYRQYPPVGYIKNLLSEQ